MSVRWDVYEQIDATSWPTHGEDRATVVDASSRRRTYGIAAAWALLIVAGSGALWRYKTTAGEMVTPPPEWPTTSELSRGDGLRLLVFVHPQCTCTRATLHELATLMAGVGHAVTTTVVVARGASGAPVDTANEELARAIPGVDVVADEGSREASRFSVRTSGQAVLYGDDDHLAFFGGITLARGHVGENDGRLALEGAIRDRYHGQASSPVYGCEIEENR
jgi:hypothetical protein